VLAGICGEGDRAYGNGLARCQNVTGIGTGDDVTIEELLKR
jgi:hypothetical protein